MYYHVFKSLGILAIIPVSVLLTFSFFVLLAIRKLDSANLKNFGKVIVILLWVCAVLVLLTVISPKLIGPCPMEKMKMHKMHKIMKGHMDSHMIQGQEPREMIAQ